jgi:hypothetical protein
MPMLRTIENLPPHVIGVLADGEVTRSDYETVLVPLLQEAYRKGSKIRLLYQTAPGFSGYTVGAMVEDMHVGLKYLRLFERCAIVTGVEWIQRGATLFGSLMPCPVKMFPGQGLKDAVAWLSGPEVDSSLTCELGDDGVLVVHPHGPLRREDFDKLAGIVDPWIEAHQQLRGLVISMPRFPGWENIGSVFQHMEFVRDHHRHIRRIALAVDGVLPEVMSHLASHFVEAAIKQFPFDQVEQARRWAAE